MDYRYYLNCNQQRHNGCSFCSCCLLSHTHPLPICVRSETYSACQQTYLVLGYVLLTGWFNWSNQNNPVDSFIEITATQSQIIPPFSIHPQATSWINHLFPQNRFFSTITSLKSNIDTTKIAMFERRYTSSKKNIFGLNSLDVGGVTASYFGRWSSELWASNSFRFATPNSALSFHIRRQTKKKHTQMLKVWHIYLQNWVVLGGKFR